MVLYLLSCLHQFMESVKEEIISKILHGKLWKNIFRDELTIHPSFLFWRKIWDSYDFLISESSTSIVTARVAKKNSPDRSSSPIKVCPACHKKQLKIPDGLRMLDSSNLRRSSNVTIRYPVLSEAKWCDPGEHSSPSCWYATGYSSSSSWQMVYGWISASFTDDTIITFEDLAR